MGMIWWPAELSASAASSVACNMGSATSASVKIGSVNRPTRIRETLGLSACKKAESATVVVTNPCTANAPFCIPGGRGVVGLKPTSPQAAAGTRIEPPPSEACAARTVPSATCSAAPPEEPPGVAPGHRGFVGAGRPTGSQSMRKPSSDDAVFDSMRAPWACRCARNGSVRRRKDSLPESTNPPAAQGWGGGEVIFALKAPSGPGAGHISVVPS